MNDTRELITAGQTAAALAVFSLLALAALVTFWAAMRRERTPGRVRGALLSGAGVLVFPLWLLYNAIEDGLGLDSVAALLINLALFLAVGGVVGLLFRRLWPRHE